MARMVVTATIVMLVNMTFRIPYGAYGAVYALTISRENPAATLKAVRVILISFAIAVADVLIGAFFFSGDPLLRPLWVFATLFLTFYALSALANYTAAARFGYMVVITIPLWDQQIRAELKVENTLWAVGAVSLASIITAVIEIVFAELKPWDDLKVSLAERLRRVEALLRSRIDGIADESNEKQVVRLGTLGTSRMRRDLERSNYSPEYAEKMGAVVSFTGRLVDLAANLTWFPAQISGEDRTRLWNLCENIEAISTDLLSQKIPTLVHPSPSGESAETLPLLGEMERAVSSIAEVFTGTQSLAPFAPPPTTADRPRRLLVPDAFSNPDHIRFAIKGGLAASLCYITYNVIAWPGLSTSITTCLLTALTTIGASRQKQALRFGGALLGGVVIGMGAQIFVLPALDSITGFTLLFVTVTVFAAWFSTSGPRLSYFGVQIAVAFYLINLQEFKFQTSLAVARDRVAGILLGLFMMWMIFDQLWGVPAMVAMKRTFISALRSLAQLLREPVGADPDPAVERTYALRETINTRLEGLREQADGVLLEFGASRQRDLALRARLLGWQRQLRTIFVVRIALLKYSLHLPGFELPPPVQTAQREFDRYLAVLLDNMADRLEGKAERLPQALESPYIRMQQIAEQYALAEPSSEAAVHLHTFLPLSQRIDTLMRSLDQEIRQAEAAPADSVGAGSELRRTNL